MQSSLRSQQPTKVLARANSTTEWRELRNGRQHLYNNLRCSNLAPLHTYMYTAENKWESERKKVRVGEVEIKISFKRWWWWYQRRVECRHWQSLLSVMPTLLPYAFASAKARLGNAQLSCSAAQETTAKHEKAHFDDCREASNACCCCHLLSR